MFNNYLFLLFAIIATFQNLFSLLVFVVFGPDSPFSTLALLAKDIVLLILLTGSGITFATDFLRGLAPTNRVLYGLFFLGITAFILGLGVKAGGPYLQDARLMMTLPMAVLLGIFLVRRLGHEMIIKNVLLLSTVVAFSGWLEYTTFLVAGEAHWKALGMSDYYMFRDDNQLEMHGADGVVPGRFYSYDVAKFFSGQPVRRFVSFPFFDPTLFGQFMACAFGLALFRGKTLLALFYMATCLCTLSKGGLLVILFVTMTWMLLFLRGALSNYRYIAFFSIALTILVGCVGYFTIGSQSMKNHVNGFIGPILKVPSQPLGAGIGTAGNRAFYRDIKEGAKLESNDEEARGEYGSESYLGSMIQQIGIAGILIYLFSFMILYPLEAVVPEFLGLRNVAIATLLTSFVTESAISYSGTFFWLSLAVCVSFVEGALFLRGYRYMSVEPADILTEKSLVSSSNGSLY